MNKLAQIESAIAAHFAAKKYFISLMPPDGESTSSDIYRASKYNPSQDAAMCLLQDILPLLQAAVVLNDELASSDAIWKHQSIYDTEVAALLADVGEGGE